MHGGGAAEKDDVRVFFPALCVGAVWFLTQCCLSHHTSPHLAYHVLADIGPANGCNSSGVPRASVGPANSHCNLAQRWPSQRPSQWPSQEPALAQPTATLSMVREIFLNGSFVSTQFRDAGDLEHPQHVTLALLFYTRHFMLLCNWAVIGEILLVYRNLS